MIPARSAVIETLPWSTGLKRPSDPESRRDSDRYRVPRAAADELLDLRSHVSRGMNLHVVCRSVDAGSGAANSPVAADGSFIIRNVAPGEYKLMARAPGEKNGEAAALPILVNGIDIDDISLTTMAGGTISGVLVSETGGPPAAPRERMRVTLRAVNTDVSPGGIPGGGMDAGRVKDDWTFTLSDIYTASRLRVMLPDGWMVKAILYNDRDISESPIELRSGEELSNVQVVVSNKVTTLSGVLADDKGAPATDGGNG
jgi:hypothetical protein